MRKREKAADFRYETGPSRIPWAAVGESIDPTDIMSVVQFLIPQGEAKAQAYRSQLSRVKREIDKLWKTGGPATKLSLGKKVQELEGEARKFLKCKHALFLTNATAGFEIAYRFAGVGPGDEVIIPAITFVATMAYPLAIGAKVVIADVDPATVNMDPKDVAKKITKRTKVIFPVHIGGYPVDMAPIMKLAREYDITVIEDAAHAYGGSYRNRMLGTIGHFGSFSFHEVKNINSLGEGGILVTNTAYGKDFAKCRFLGVDPSRQIPNWLYDVVAIKGKGGYFAAPNHSSTEIQAVGLLSQMKRLPRVIAERRKVAEYLNERFKKVKGIITPPLGSKTTRPTYHLYLLQIDPDLVGGNIQDLKAKLNEKGIVQIPHFAPLYKFSVMRQLGYDTAAIQRSCPQTEEVFNNRFTHLPLYKFTKSQIKLMADSVIEAVEELKAGA